MRVFLPLVFSILSIAVCAAQDGSGQWKLIYENDASGAVISGDLESLKEAIRSGQEIRIGWGSSRVEHFADAKFLTIMQDSTVMAQIDPIAGQTPDFENQQIVMKENMEWTLIANSNGKSDAMMRNSVTGEIAGHNRRPRGIKWFVEGN